MQHFQARLDNLTKTISFVLPVALIIPFSSIFFQYQKLHDPLLLIGPLATILILSIAALFRPTGYELDDSLLIVKRATGSVKIATDDIRSIELQTKKELGAGIRVLGSAGFLGYFGKFYYRDHGWISVYATDSSKTLLIVLKDGRKIIISPDDTDAFMSSFRSLKRKP